MPPPYFNDVWRTQDGIAWELIDAVPWNAESPSQMKCDFDALAAPFGPQGLDAIHTFGGDREIFDPFDPHNYLNVDNDTWAFAPAPEPSAMVLGV